METALIAATVAAFVSLLSLVVQLWLARATRKSAEHAPHRQLLTDERKSQLAVIRQSQAALEEIRMHTWTLLGCLHHVLRDYRIPSDLLPTIEGLETSTRQFASLWAQTKFDIPDGAQTHLRRIWHECYPQFMALRGLRDFLKTPPGNNADSVVTQKRLRELLSHLPDTVLRLESALNHIREFAEVLAAAKKNVLHDDGEA